MSMASCAFSATLCPSTFRNVAAKENIELCSSRRQLLAQSVGSTRQLNSGSAGHSTICLASRNFSCCRGSDPLRTSFLSQTDQLSPKQSHFFCLERRAKRRDREAKKIRATFFSPGDAVDAVGPLLGKAAAGVGWGASSLVSLGGHVWSILPGHHHAAPAAARGASSFFLGPWVPPFFSLGPLTFLSGLAGLASMVWFLPLVGVVLVVTTFILTFASLMGLLVLPFAVFVPLYLFFTFKTPIILFKMALDTILSAFLVVGTLRTALAAFKNRNQGDVADLELRLSRSAVSPPSAGGSVIAAPRDDVPFWTYFPLLAPFGWWHLGQLAGDKATYSRCFRNMIVYAAPTAVFLLGLGPPIGGGAVLLGPVLGPLHLELERRILRRERLLKLVDEAERAGEAAALKSNVGQGRSAAKVDRGVEKEKEAVEKEEEEEQRKRAEELAMFDSMLEARWWSGRAAPKAWSIDDVAEWLLKEGFSQECCKAFIANHITGEVLLDLSDDDLREHLDIRSFGLRRSLLSRIADLRSKSAEYNYPRS